MEWWMHDAYENGGIVLLFSWVFWVIASIVLHELAHGWAAIANGDGTPRELGHMTINPVVHMGWMSLLFFALAGFAWGMMPTNPSRYRHERRGRVLVAAAGPAMNLAIALVSLTAAGAWMWAVSSQRIAPAEHVVANVTLFLWLGGFLNLVLAAFNLLPVPPLDGSNILAGASPALDRFFSSPAVRMYGLIVMLVLFFRVVDMPLQRTMRGLATDYAGWVATSLGDVAGRGRAPAEGDAGPAEAAEGSEGTDN
jgi:Zn-dependent protease